MLGLQPIATAYLWLAAVINGVDADIAPVISPAGSEDLFCSLIQAKFSGHTFFPGSAGYIYETRTQYWSATLYEGPACVFLPQSAQDLSIAVITATLTLTKFAVRGGGHMPIPDYNNINSAGILLSTSNLTGLSLSSDSSSVSIGAGNRWRDVYTYLEPYSLAAGGGRIGDVGVSGYFLGGGISFYSSEYGFGSDTILQYEVVLASGAVVEANATNDFSDLFWALKGGANSFAIVTRFDVRTVPSPRVWVGITQYNQSQSTQYLDAVFNFAKYGALDSKAAIIPTIVTYPSSNATFYAAARFYDSDLFSPTVFENFTAPQLVPVADSFAPQTLAAYITAVDPLQPTGLRQAFRAMSSIVDKEAVELIHDLFLSEVNSKLTNVTGLTASVTFQPVTKDFIQHGINNGGNPQGVDVSKAPYLWMVENWTWNNEEDDAAVKAAADAITADINNALTFKGLVAQYMYLNDAGEGQSVFTGYPKASLARLKAIRAKYDPLLIYTNLLIGGWKVVGA